nr:hypothetical protein [Tanacetum cinerariifolium]
MAIPMVILNDEIKAFANYLEYLTKSKGGKPAKGHGPNEGSGVNSMVPDEPSGSSSSFSLDSDDEIEDISSDDDDKAIEGKKPETQVDTTVLDNRLTRLENKVEAMSWFNIPVEINKAMKAHLKKNVLPKDVPNFDKLKSEKTAKQQTLKYSTTPFDEDSLEEYDQKANLKNNLLQRRDVEIIMFKILLQIHKRRKRKRREKKDSKSLKKDKEQAGSSMKGKSLSKSSKADKPMNAKETIHGVEMDVGKSIKEDVVDVEEPSQADASVPKRDTSTWFRTVIVERSKSPDP